MKIRIESNIPIPQKRTRSANKKRREPKFPFAQMKIGDSIAVPNRNSACVCAWHFAKKHPEFRFVSRITKDKAGRIWRVLPKLPKENTESAPESSQETDAA